MTKLDTRSLALGVLLAVVAQGVYEAIFYNNLGEFRQQNAAIIAAIVAFILLFVLFAVFGYFKVEKPLPEQPKSQIETTTDNKPEVQK
ncbi:MAG TPA: hypothetical protein VK487_09615 [Candidatus Bathyarchaeia archaeon]|nr:hypothetical protein [Candidatus Bathyarchaeia archaeon]